MKRSLSLLLAILMILALTACASTATASRIDEILEMAKSIRETVDAIPPDFFAPEDPDTDDRSVTFLAEDSDFRRQTKRGTLTVGIVAERDSFDPCTSTFAAGMQLVYDPLFTLDENGEIRGVLAEEWEYRDATHIYIRIHDASFSNGDPVTAEDCLWSLRRFTEKDGRWRHLFDFLDTENSEILSSTEFILALKDDFGPGLRYLACYFSSVLDKSYVETTEGAFNDYPVGSGPYVYIAGEDGAEGTFELREEYWNTEAVPEAKTITIRCYSESAALFSDYENGDLDMAFALDSVDAERLLAGNIADTNYVIQDGCDVCTLVLPEDVVAFNDLRVRRAVSLAVNWDLVRESGLGVLGSASDSVLSGDVFGKQSFGTYEYDPDAAMVLLEEAEYDFSQSFEFIVLNSDAEIRMAKAIQRDLQAVGINVHVGVCGRSDMESRYNAGESELLLCSLGRPALDPDQVFDAAASWSDCTGTRISEEPLVSYLTVGRWSSDSDIRAEAYRNAQSWIYETIRQIPIADMYGCYCYRPYIDPDFRCGSVTMPDLRLVRFS